MKNLPDEKTLLELLELAKDAEQYARETSEIITNIAHKWEKKGYKEPKGEHQPAKIN